MKTYNDELNSQNVDKSEEKFKMKCVAGNLKLNIDANGDIYPCDFLKFEKFKCGSVLDNFQGIWDSNVLIDLYKMKRIDKIECANCRNKDCTTGCMGFSYEKFGSINRKDPNCNYVQEVEHE